VSEAVAAPFVARRPLIEAQSIPRADVRLMVLVALLSAAVAWWASEPYAVGVFHDDGVYVILGKALATGHGYRYLHLPGAPAATHYPPLYPLLLAGLWRIAPNFPANVSLFLFVNALLLGAATFGVARFAERVVGWPRSASICVALAATLATPLLMLSGLVLSEPLFAAALLPLIIAAEGAVRQEQRAARVVLLGLGLGALALVRTHAVALGGAVIVLLFFRRRWRDTLLCGVGFLAALAPWQVWLSLHSSPMSEVLRGSYGPYGPWMAEGLRDRSANFIATTVAINGREIGALLADHFSLGDTPNLRRAASVLATLAIGFGAARLWLRAPVFVLFAFFYTVILLVVPFTPWRYVYAVWPVVVLCVAAGIDGVMAALRSRALPPRLLGAVAATGVAALALGAAREETRAYRLRSWQQPTAAATAQISPLVRWVKTETKPNDIVAADGEQIVYLFGGRVALPIAPFTAAEYVYPRKPEDDARSLRSELAEFPVSYVVTISPALRSSADLIAVRSTKPADGAAHPRLVALAPLGDGEAYRVERR
jgi:hypothetical protein